MKPPSANAHEPIKCPDLQGRVQTYPAEQVKYRPAAYGILQHQGQVLLGHSRFTGSYITG